MAERNRCADVSCLGSSYSHRIAQLKAYVVKNVANCAISEKDLLGAWTNSDAGDFEELAFDIYDDKHAFMSWLHHHPEMSGMWSLENCQLHIEDSSDPTLSFDYRIKRYTRRALYLQDDTGTVSVYKKAK